HQSAAGAAACPSGGGMTGALEIEGLTKRFGEKQALAEIALRAAPGEILGISGPSGAGKTTLLRILSGLETADTGHIALSGDDITHRSPQQRRFALMFESYALYPHLTVYENIVSPLRAPAHRERYRAAIDGKRVEEILALTEIDRL